MNMSVVGASSQICYESIIGGDMLLILVDYCQGFSSTQCAAAKCSSHHYATDQKNYEWLGKFYSLCCTAKFKCSNISLNFFPILAATFD